MRSRLPVVLLASLLAACADATGSPHAYRGMTAGMPTASLRAAATAAGIGGMECRPLAVANVPADLLCYTPDSAASTVNVSAMVNSADSLVPYVVVREGLTGSADPFGRLRGLWGDPDTVIGSGHRWHDGAWVASADTALGILTVWLTDTATDQLVAAASARERFRASGADTLPISNTAALVLDSLISDPTAGTPPVPAGDLTRPPSVISCERVPPPAHLSGRDGSVTLAYVVDSAGQVEPGNVRLIEATHAGLVEPAVATILSCRLEPGRTGERAVRALVQQRVTYSATATP